MADLPYDAPADDQPITNRDAAFNVLQDLAPEGEAQQTVGEIATRLSDYQQKSQLVEANEQAGANFVNDLSGWKNGMESAVRNDPNFVHTAMDITTPFINGMVDSIPGSDPEHADTLIRDMHHDLATLSVYSAAEQNGPLARSLLGNGRISGLLSDEEKGSLDRYIGHQEDARARDDAAQRIQAVRAQSQETNDRTLGWATLLSSGTMPPGWHASVLADQNIDSETKGHLGDLASKLMAEGDNKASDAFLLTDYVNRLANGDKLSTETLMQGVTQGNLTMNDMAHLSTRGLGGNPQEAATLASTLDAAQQRLLGSNNENGIAGATAYTRFTNWLMGQYRNAGPGSLDSRSENYLFSGADESLLDKFYPRGDDLLKSVSQANRPPLSTFFGSGKSESEILSEGPLFGKSIGPGIMGRIMQGHDSDGTERTDVEMNKFLPKGGKRTGDDQFEMDDTTVPHGEDGRYNGGPMKQHPGDYDPIHGFHRKMDI